MVACFESVSKYMTICVCVQLSVNRRWSVCAQAYDHHSFGSIRLDECGLCTCDWFEWIDEERHQDLIASSQDLQLVIQIFPCVAVGTRPNT